MNKEKEYVDIIRKEDSLPVKKKENPEEEAKKMEKLVNSSIDKGGPGSGPHGGGQKDKASAKRQSKLTAGQNKLTASMNRSSAISRGIQGAKDKKTQGAFVRGLTQSRAAARKK